MKNKRRHKCQNRSFLRLNRQKQRFYGIFAMNELYVCFFSILLHLRQNVGIPYHIENNVLKYLYTQIGLLFP